MTRFWTVPLAAALAFALLPAPARAQFEDDEQPAKAKKAPPPADEEAPPKREQKKRPAADDEEAPSRPPPHMELPDKPATREAAPEEKHDKNDYGEDVGEGGRFEREHFESEEGADTGPRTRSIGIDLGGGVAALGGLTLLKGTLEGASDDYKFHAPGLGPGLNLHYDFPLADLDWRVGLMGLWPGFVALDGLTGIRKDVGPWTNPKVIARGGAGLEIMLGHIRDDEKTPARNEALTYIAPVFIGLGETSIEYEVVPNRLDLGAGMQVAARLGLPIGFGLNFMLFLRASVWF